MNNNMHIQNLMNMKLQLSNMESQFNLLLTQIQNMGLFPEISNQINNISFQFINFGIQMLRTGTQINNNTEIKEQINNAINNLNNISMTIPNNIPNIINNEINIMPFSGINENIEQVFPIKVYNITFVSHTGNRTVIRCEPNKAVDELIKMFLVKIGRVDLNDNEIIVTYNASVLNTYENKMKKLSEIFNNAAVQIVEYNILNEYKLI